MGLYVKISVTIRNEGLKNLNHKEILEQKEYDFIKQMSTSEIM